MVENSYFEGPYRDIINWQSMFLCSLWRIDRTDTQIEYYTNWDEDIIATYPGTPSLTFRSAAGLQLSATSRESGLKSQSMSARGFIDGLSETDLRGGAYTDAKVTEWVVDARAAHLPGAVMYKTTYWVTNVSHSSEVWEMELEGIGRKLKESLGVPYNQQCRFSLGSSGCAPIPPNKTHGISIAQFTWGGNTGVQISEVDVNTPRRVFSLRHGTGSPSLLPQAKLSHGTITFLTGDNAGFTYEVMTQRTDVRDINVKLMLETHSDIKVGDTAKCIAGCSGTWSACGFYKNRRSFGGNQFIPGAQRANQSARTEY